MYDYNDIGGNNNDTASNYYWQIGSVPRLMRVDNEEDEEEDVDVEIVSTSQYAGVRTRKGKVLVWSALGDNTLILEKRLCC